MDKKAYCKHLGSLLLFGLNGIVASHIPLSSYEIVLFRTFLGSILLSLLFLLGKGKFHVVQHRKDTVFIVLSGIAMGTSWMFLYEAYQTVGVGMGTLLNYCGPVIIMILSPVLFREKLTAPKVIGFLIVLAGLFLINKTGQASEESPWGFFCGIMSAVLYFFMITLNKKAERITGLENTVIQLVAGFLTVAAFVGLRQGFALAVPPEAWGWILLLGLVHTGFGCYLYFSSMSKLPVQTVAVCGYLEPLGAVVFAAVLLGERMSVHQMIGAACIIGGAMIGELIKARRKTI